MRFIYLCLSLPFLATSFFLFLSLYLCLCLSLSPSISLCLSFSLPVSVSLSLFSPLNVVFQSCSNLIVKKQAYTLLNGVKEIIAQYCIICIDFIPLSFILSLPDIIRLGVPHWIGLKYHYAGNIFRWINDIELVKLISFIRMDLFIYLSLYIYICTRVKQHN